MTFLKIPPIQRAVIQVTILISAIKILGFLRDILIAYFFGINSQVDIYFYTLIIPTFLYGIIMGSFNTYFIPIYLRLKTSRGQAVAKEYFIRIFLFACICISILAFLCIQKFPQWFLALNKSVIFQSPENVKYFFELSQFGAILFFGMTLGSVVIALMRAEHRYLPSLYPEFLIPLCSIAFIVFFAERFHVAAALYGAATGAIACLIILFIYSLRKRIIQLTYTPHFPINIIQNADQFTMLVFTTLTTSLVYIIDRQMATSLGSGKLTTLNYGLSIPDGLYEIVAYGIGVVFLSHFSQWYAEGRKNLMTEATQRIIIYTSFLVLPLCIFLMVYARPILSIILERGAFTAEDTSKVADILRHYVFILFLVVPGLIGGRILSVIGKNQILFVIGCLMLVVKVVSNIFLIKVLDLNGIALSSLIMYITSNILTFAYLHRYNILIFQPALLQQVFLGGIFAAFLWVATTAIHSISSGCSDFLQILTGGLFITAALLILLKANRQYGFIRFSGL